ncbi:ParB/RepB/Spo0J family partition protein [Kitasatospora sp. NPDC059646]|uniref:ParB/RepB/Spo0J family partition protein n=1 Tax=Kitasatospora sp. NPDC059646 TaxID=3346893 RepID=UPI0036909AAE
MAVKPWRNQANKLGKDREKAGLGEAGAGGEQPDDGNGTGVHKLDREEGEMFFVDPANISPNPMNRRLTMRRMDEMVESVKRQGVHTPGAAISMHLFVKFYPEWESRIENPEAEYILGPGHRRRLAAEQAGKKMLVILRNRWARERTVEENLISENSDRDDLSPIEEALQLDLLRQRGMTGDEIAARSGYKNRGTVSKLLNLLDLPQAIQDAIHAGPKVTDDQDDTSEAVTFGISPKAGYVLSTIKDTDGENDTEAAHALQLRAFAWMREEGLSAEAAKNRLQAEAALGSGEAFPAGNTEADPSTDAGTGSAGPEDVSRGKHPDGEPDGESESELDGEEDVSRGKHGEPGAGAPSIPHQPDGSEEEHGSGGEDEQEAEPEPDPAAEAAATRDLACRMLLSEEKYASAGATTAHLVNAVLNPSEWKEAATLAHTWLRELGKGPNVGRPAAYMAAVAAEGDANLMRRCAFAVALAADELRAAQPDREWDARDRAHIEFLVSSKAGYQPTAWERERLAPVTTSR